MYSAPPTEVAGTSTSTQELHMQKVTEEAGWLQAGRRVGKNKDFIRGHALGWPQSTFPLRHPTPSVHIVTIKMLTDKDLWYQF